MYTKFLAQAKAIGDFHRAQYRGVYFMFGGGGTQTTTQKSDPWSKQQPYLTGNDNPNLSGSSANPPSIFNSAAQLYSNPSDYPQYYPNSTVQPFNSMQTGAIGDIYNTGTQGTSALNSANNSLTNFNNGSFLSAGNPYFGQMAQAVESQLTPQLESQFTQGNAMNNPAAAFSVSQGLGTALGSLAYQNYSDQLGNMIKSAALSPGQQGATLSGQQTAYNAGAEQQTQDQSQLSDMVNRYTYNQSLPFQMLNQYANTVNGQYGGTSTLSQPYSNNTSSNLLSTGTSLAGDASMLWALGAFSDRRLKRNIIRIGTLISGLPVYAFKYLWSNVPEVGVMADEVEKLIPQAVTNILGFHAVNYEMVGA